MLFSRKRKDKIKTTRENNVILFNYYDGHGMRYESSPFDTTNYLRQSVLD